ncbi:hypothetical protein [Parafrankia sp. EUN1f]|uniref:hypothetical protein n=1 Tax=Parafrankia sp. EUN1f TaxID=102897 RepID=UPI0001C43F5B|nr:hypothetical protein [Parafrankia sp. EUN1f]EFC82539.1 hypothetical protein FrEUN1fDRAFT_4336 [Parafrankia sp. EUN1f]
MRTDAESSRFAACRRLVIATVSAGTVPVAAVSVVLTLCAGVSLAGCGDAQGRSAGAPPPARPGSATSSGAAAGAGAETPASTTTAGPDATAATGAADPGESTPGGTGGASAGGPAARDDSPAGAGRIVSAYYGEINAAAQAGRVADISATALPGCQTCALDVGMTRYLDQTGARAAQAPYEITGLAAGARRGTVVDVRFAATTRAVGLLDPAGRDAGQVPAVPTRSAVAQLVLTGPGWRIQNITYAAGQRS